MNRKDGQIVYPDINSPDKKERNLAQVGIIMKFEYKSNNLTIDEIQFSEAIPNWSWELSEDEIKYLNNNTQKRI